MTVLHLAITALSDEFNARGNKAQFDLLRPLLTGDTADLSQAELAEQLDMNADALKVAVHRMRKRFRELVRLEVRQTLNHPDQLHEEMDYLVKVLSRRS